MRRLALLVALASFGAYVLAPGSAQAAFGLNNFDVTFNAADGGLDTQAGSHPATMTTRFQLNRTETGSAVLPDGAPKEVVVALPPGFVGYPNATPQCAAAEFSKLITSVSLPSCPNSSAIGMMTIEFSSSAGETGLANVPVYNLAPPPGAVNELGFVVLNVPITVEVTVSHTPPYRVVARSRSISQALNFLGADLVLGVTPLNQATTVNGAAASNPTLSKNTANTSRSENAPSTSQIVRS